MLTEREKLIPRYYQIYEDLYKLIEEGKFEDGDKFPSDNELVSRYSVSRGTIREAIRLLFQQGLLVRQQGKGTFVTKNKMEQDAKRLMGFTELMKTYGITPSAVIIEKNVKFPNPHVKNVLHLSDEQKIVKIKRLRFGNNEPLIIERSYFVHNLFKEIEKEDFENDSIYRILYEKTNIRLGEAKQSIEAITLISDDAKLLKIPTGSPALLLKRIIKTTKDEYFQYSEDIYRTDKLNFTIKTVSYDEFHNDNGMPVKFAPKQF